MPAVREFAGRLLSRRDRPPPGPHRSVPFSAEAPQTLSEQRLPGLVVVSSVGYGIHCVYVDGALSLATAGLLDTAAAGVSEPGPAELDLVILDLADVTFLDAVGVAALHRAHCCLRGRAEVRIDLPRHPGPRSMLRVATDHGWLAPVFRPDGIGPPSRPGRRGT